MKNGIIQWKPMFERILLLTGVWFTLLPAQVDMTPNEDQSSRLYVEVYAFASDLPGKGRIDLYVQVPYPEISFVKENDQYTGRFEIYLNLQSQGQQPWQQSQLVEVHLNDFSQTISERFFSVKQFSTDLAPGTYELLVQVTDLESKKILSSKQSVLVKDFGNDPFALSDVMLVKRLTFDGARKNIVPNLTGIISKETENFYLFFEIYNRIPVDSVQLVCSFISSKRQITGRRMKNEHLTGNRTQAIWLLDTLSVPSDTYTIVIEASGKSVQDTGKSFAASVTRKCIIRTKNMPSMISDIDKAVDQLQYIAKGGELDYIREAPTPEEKQKRFLEFWSKHNPDPKAPTNSFMEEYYSRVDYANRNYASFVEGWRTDRGMVLIIFGPPQNVERHPFDSNNKPFEIWYYYTQNREFIFVDETGFGDYRLRYPETDLWGRVR